MDSVATIVLWAVPVVFAITLHEAAHGYVAKLFGDQTAWMLGRVTANPIKHIDPVGTILVPGMLLLMRQIRRPAVHLRVGEAGAGQFRQPAQPEAGHVLGGGRRTRRQFRDGDRLGDCCCKDASPGGRSQATACMEMAGAGYQINLMLMALNLLPILPLDGGRIAVSLLPHSMAMSYARMEPYGFMIVIVLLVTGVLMADAADPARRRSCCGDPRPVSTVAERAAANVCPLGARSGAAASVGVITCSTIACSRACARPAGCTSATITARSRTG